MDGEQYTFDIDTDEIFNQQHLFGATDKEVLAAYNRALSRTSVTMKSRSNKMMRDETGAKNLKLIRKRMQVHRYSFHLGQSDAKKLDELKLWYGLNDMSVGHLRGRVRRVGSARNPAGAEFISSKLGSNYYSQGFVSRRYKRRSIFMRKGKARSPLMEARAGIVDRLQTKLEDDTFVSFPEVFMQHFITDLKGRVAARDVVVSRQRSWNRYK